VKKLLQKMGFTPYRETQKNIVFTSPFNRDEKTPSFYVFLNEKWDGKDEFRKYNYKDFSSGNGGNIYDFVMKYYNLDFTGARTKIKELRGYATQTPSNFSFNQTKKIKETKEIEILATKELQNKSLVGYLIERKIYVNIAKKYLSEIYYKINNKDYFAFSFVNEAGGREIRNRYFKGGFGKKDITLITPNPKSKKLKVFEGFMDFLSSLTITQKYPLDNYLILNSVSLRERGLKAVQGKYETIELYFDNDKAGSETTKYFLDALPNAIDKRELYKEYKDLNDFLIKSDILEGSFELVIC